MIDKPLTWKDAVATAKTLSDLMWENALEFSEWLKSGITESKSIKLAEKYGEKWVSLGLVLQLREQLQEHIRNIPSSLKVTTIHGVEVLAFKPETFEKWFEGLREVLGSLGSGKGEGDEK